MKNTMKKIILFLMGIIAATTGLAGCAPYKAKIPQGDPIPYEIVTSGYQVIDKKPAKNEFWYDANPWHNNSIVTNQEEFEAARKLITDQAIQPVDWDEYLLFIYSDRTSPAGTAKDRFLRVHNVTDISIGTDSLIFHIRSTNKVIKAEDGSSHVGYYQILKIKKSDFPDKAMDFRAYGEKYDIDTSKDEYIYLK